MNLSGYNQLEQLSDDELDYLETSILARLSGYVNVVRLYVVGSFCFGLDKVNDIDVVVCISEDDVIINQDQHDTSGVFYMIKDIYSGLLSRDLNIKVSMIPNNWGKFLSNDVKRVKPPYFDLTERMWINKEPGDKWNYYIMRDGHEVWTVDRDSDEGKRLAIDNNKI